MVVLLMDSCWSLSFNPSELLKIGFLIYIAAWISGVKRMLKHLNTVFCHFVYFARIRWVILLAQPDTDTYIILAATTRNVCY